MSTISTLRDINLKKSLCCGHKECCYNTSCDIALNLLPGGFFSDEYVDCLYNIRHLMKKLSFKGWFFAFWIDSIYFDCSERLAPLAMNQCFNDALTHSFSRRLRERFSVPYSSRSILLFLSQVEYRPVPVIAEAKERNRKLSAMQAKLSKYCQIAEDIGYPFCLAYIDQHGAGLCEGDSVSKAYFSGQIGIWNDLLFPLMRKEVHTVAHHQQVRRIGNQRVISAEIWRDAQIARRRPQRIFPKHDVRNLLTLLSQDTLFPVTPISIREDGTKVLAFPNIYRDGNDDAFKGSNTRPQTVRKH